jgi:hypothetical protein
MFCNLAGYFLTWKNLKVCRSFTIYKRFPLTFVCDLDLWLWNLVMMKPCDPFIHVEDMVWTLVVFSQWFLVTLTLHILTFIMLTIFSLVNVNNCNRRTVCFNYASYSHTRKIYQAMKVLCLKSSNYNLLKLKQGLYPL